MIRKTHRNFIFGLMAFIFVVFSVFYLALHLVFKNQNNRVIFNALNENFRIYKETNETFLSEKFFVATLTLTEASENNNFTAVYDSNVFNDELMQTIVDKAFSENYVFGKLDSYYYMTVENQQYPTLICLDAQENLQDLRHNNLIVLLFLAIIYCVVILFIWGLSFKITNPVKETLIKQRQFISNASHELKTPISIISANNDVLKSIDNNEWTKNINSQVMRMESLVTDMLTLSKYDENIKIINKEKFNLSDTIVSTALSFDALAFEKGNNIVLNVPKNISYFGDNLSVKKLMNILLDNAIKYSTKNTDILVSLIYENRPILSVYNVGCDVPDSETNKVFDRFYRADNSRARTTGGSGLGLAIAQSIAEANNWKISANSRQGEFMKITVLF